MTPLARRLPRQLRNNVGRYLGLFFMVFLTVAFVGGFLDAARSIQLLLDDWRATTSREDYSFATQFQASDEALDAASQAGGGSTIYENFYADVPLTVLGRDQGHEATVRLYKNRTDIDKVLYFEGRAPQEDDEIALDRLFMKNNDLAIGDTVQVGDRQLAIVGQCVLADYEALVASNMDLMFDTITFTTSQVTPEAFDALAGSATVWHYSAIANDGDLSPKGRVDLESDVAKALIDHETTLTELLDRDQNNAMTFVGDDIEGDSVMYEILGVLIISISAFVFVVLTGASIEQESAVIGTLLASGYRKRELVRHYLAMPAVVGMAATVAGAIVGRFVVMDACKDMYYNSYSLPPFRAYFSLDVFLATTVLPVAMLIVISWLGIRRKLRATPLAFLRHEVGRKSATASASLPERWGFVARFRLRVFLRNASHFAVLAHRSLCHVLHATGPARGWPDERLRGGGTPLHPQGPARDRRHGRPAGGGSRARPALHVHHAHGPEHGGTGRHHALLAGRRRTQPALGSSAQRLPQLPGGAGAGREVQRHHAPGRSPIQRLQGIRDGIRHR